MADDKLPYLIIVLTYIVLGTDPSLEYSCYSSDEPAQTVELKGNYGTLLKACKEARENGRIPTFYFSSATLKNQNYFLPFNTIALQPMVLDYEFHALDKIRTVITYQEYSGHVDSGHNESICSGDRDEEIYLKLYRHLVLPAKTRISNQEKGKAALIICLDDKKNTDRLKRALPRIITQYNRLWCSFPDLISSQLDVLLLDNPVEST